MGYPGEAAGVGGGIGLISWLVLVIRAHLDLRLYRGTHPAGHEGGSDVAVGGDLRPR